MLLTKNTLQKFLISSIALTLINCGGGGGSTPSPAKEIKEAPITGITALGPIVGGSITAYDFSAGTKGAVLQTAAKVTDATGTYTLSMKSKSKPMLLCIIVRNLQRSCQ